MKYQIILEANSLVELVEKAKEEFRILTDEEKNVKEYQKLLGKKINPEMRKNKPWTEYELNFLTEHYKSKSIKWIASSLSRPDMAVRQKLFHLYKKGLQKIRKRTINL